MTHPSSKRFRMWALRSQGNLVLKENGGNTPTAECTGVDEQQSSVFTMIINTATASPMEVSWHFVFRAKDGTEYALYVDEQQDPTVLNFQPFTSSLPTTAAFVPEGYCTVSPGPFKAVKLSNSQKCIASNRDGVLTLKSFKKNDPHPDTIFVISEID